MPFWDLSLCSANRVSIIAERIKQEFKFTVFPFSTPGSPAGKDPLCCKFRIKIPGGFHTVCFL